MTDPRDLIQRLADELDHYKQLLMDDRRETHLLATEARAYLAQRERGVPTISMNASEQWAVLSWVEDHIDTNKALRSWRDPTRGGLLMAEVHTVQPRNQSALEALPDD